MTAEPGTRTFTGTEARLMLRRARVGALGTLARQGGAPYVSVINLATDVAGPPVIFVSGLAWHTQNLRADSRASVMVANLPTEGDALTGPRITVIGRFAEVEDAALKARYAARHPQARTYLEFADFGLWRLEPETIHAVAGFGRIETLKPEEVFLSAEMTAEIAGLALSAAAHINADHADAVRLYATKLAQARDGDWRVTAIDPDGFLVEAGGTARHIAFDAPVFTAAALREAFAALAQRARLL